MKQTFQKLILLSVACLTALAAWAAPDREYLCFTANSANSTVWLQKKGSPVATTIEYSIDDGANWIATNFASESSTNTIKLANAGDKVYFRNAADSVVQKFSESRDNNYGFKMTGSLAASGNVMSLIDKTCKATKIPCNYCFVELFKECTSLTSTPRIPATTLTEGCYDCMFYGCTSLSQATELPAMVMVPWCYQSMFHKCSNLTHAPKLPSFSLAKGCYKCMFESTGLQTAPVLPAEVLVDECYAYMFNNCRYLDNITVYFTSWTPSNATKYWTDGVASNGTFMCPTELPSSSDIPEGWTIDRFSSELYFMANTAGATVKLLKEGTPDEVTFEYSADGETWSPYTVGEDITLPSANDRVYFHKVSQNLGLSKDKDNYYHFAVTGSLAAGGSVMVLADTSIYSIEVPTPYCFYGLFENCSGLTVAPHLSATTLTEGCYESMFKGCTSLTAIPQLFAVTLADSCYMGMFEGCSSLTAIPELRATTLAPSCYNRMFKGCTGLTVLPTIGATTLADNCCNSMFQDCTALAEASQLPASTLAPGCYQSMFKGCTSLTAAPKLPALVLQPDCYRNMFDGCSSLNKINVAFADWLESQNATTQWVKGVASTGSFSCLEGLTGTGEDKIPEGWNVKTLDYLCFTANTDSSTVKLNIVGSPASTTMRYHTPSTGWNLYNYGDSILLNNAGDQVYFCNDGIASEFSKDGTNHYTFAMTGSIAASGNVMSLIDNTCTTTAIPGKNCFNSLFSGCTALTTAPQLPATTLADGCYISMFNGCTSLTAAPQLPATTMLDKCYSGMFNGCTSLAKAPQLPATNLEYECYSNMFSGCTSLTKAPELPATNLEYGCYSNMFEGCYNLTQTPELPATDVTSYCYTEMFKGCSKLTTAPQLPATTLDDGCYQGMFQNCFNLTTAPELPATKLASGCYARMFRGCPSLKTAPALPATSLESNCYEGMFYECVNLTTAPQLPATVLRNNCYKEMFHSCESLSAAPQLPATELGNNCYEGMFQNCINLATAPQLPATELWSNCYKNMFYGCSSLTTAPQLPATTLEQGCYYGMFQNCAKLATAPELPATDLKTECYYGMFQNCIKLTTAPELPATELKSKCYSQMFNGCANLNYIKVGFSTWPTGNELESWVKGVAAKGTFVYSGKLSMTYGDSNIPSGWETLNNGALRFTANTAGSTVMLKKVGSPAPVALEYSLNEGKWTSYNFGETITLADTSDCVMFRNAADTVVTRFSTNYITDFYQFAMTGSIAASGDIMSLVDKTCMADTLPGDFAFTNLFWECSSLTSTPQLPATGLSQYCYMMMFKQCTSLVAAPQLPATVMKYNCYAGMFDGCTSLTQAPKLPATDLTGGMTCYSMMFSGCTSLTQAPKLPATKLDMECYRSMFMGCTNLETAPTLPADSLPQLCYAEMFKDCTKLNKISVAFSNWTGSFITYDWVKNVAPTGTFTCPKELAQEFGKDRIPEGWTVKEPEYLCFTANIDNATVTLKKVGRPYENSIEFRTDSADWASYNYGDAICLNKAGDKVYFRNSSLANGFSIDNGNSYKFVVTDSVAVSGNVMSLVDNTSSTTEIPNDGCFYRLFENCTGITTAPNMPATSLTECCYYQMFKGCTRLTQAPSELPATTLVRDCYSYMFDGCSALTQAPELPATTLADWCYYFMFRNCSALTQAPELPATTLADMCYYNMFNGCSALTQAPELPADSLANDCYGYMFRGCSSLTQAPELPATTLADECYFWMFAGCTSLAKAPELPATTLAPSCYNGMFANCASLTMAPELPATTLAGSCYNSMFIGCTSLHQAPELPATTLTENCYQLMFIGCTSLAHAPALPATTLANGCYSEMFEGCSSLTQAPALPATTLAENCYMGMFASCTNLTKAPELPATTLVKGCYAGLFYECENLNYVKAAFTEWYDDEEEDYYYYYYYLNSTEEWLSGVAEKGTFICPAGLELRYGESYIPEGWTVNGYTVTATQDPYDAQYYYATFYSSESAYTVPQGVTAYTGVVDGNLLRMAPVEGNVIPAGEAVVLRATAVQDNSGMLKDIAGNQIQFVLTVTDAASPVGVSNDLTGTDVTIESAPANSFFLLPADSGVGYYPCNGDGIDAHSAFLQFDTPVDIEAFLLKFDQDTPTGIDDLKRDNQGDGKMYDILGRPVNDDYKGIVIMNGKKFVKK